MDNLKRSPKIVHAGDAYIWFHKIATMLEDYIENGNYLSNIENKKRRKNDKSRRD